MEEEVVVNWTFSALEMLAELHDYLQEHRSESSADKYVSEIIESTERLERHPESCAPCRNKRLKEQGFRCCNVKDHIIIYEFLPPTVNILAVIHSKRNPDLIEI